MAVATRAPLPHSVLLGRERVSRTTYFYDETTGRLESSITVHDAAWLADDVDKAIGADRWQHHPYHCPQGHLLAPWQDEAGVELEDPPFAVGLGYCPACHLLDDDAEDARDDPGRNRGHYPLFKPADDVDVEVD